MNVTVLPVWHILCIVTALLVLLAAPLARAADDPRAGDIRDLKVGIAVDQLPRQGYERFSCAGDGGQPDTPLGGFGDYWRCAPNAQGWYEIGFHYDDSQQQWAAVNDKWEGTKVAGHPVLLSLLIDEAGAVKGIRAQTDPEARAYMKKKAYLLSFRVKARYGSEGWSCQRRAPEAGETPVGNLYINERCEKNLGDRRVVVYTQLYRGPEQRGREFTNATRFEILAAS